jgi:hypothetical protein
MVNVKLVLVRTRTLVQKKTDLKNTNKERTIFDHGIRPIVHCRHLCLNTSVQLTRLPLNHTQRLERPAHLSVNYESYTTVLNSN